MMYKGLIFHCICVSLFGGLLFGYSCAGISAALSKLFYPLLNIEPQTASAWKIPLLIASVNAGGLFGSAFVPYLAPEFDACSMIYIGSALNMCAFIGMLSSCYTIQTLGRVLTGAGIGIVCTVCPAYVSAISPPKHRGALIGLFQVSIAIGVCLASLVAHFILGSERDLSGSEFFQALLHTEAPLHRIRLLFIPSVVQPMLLTFTTIVTRPKQPLVDLANTNVSSQEALVELNDQASNQNLLRKCIQACPRSFLIAFISVAALQLTGINAVWFYVYTILDAPGINHQSFGALLVMAINLTATIGAVLICDRIGRRPLMITGMCVMSLSLVFLSFFDEIIEILKVAHSSVTHYLILFVAIGMYIYGFAIGIGMNFWVVCNEILPAEIYQEAFALINIIKWIFIIVVTFFFPILEAKVKKHVFLPFSAVAIMSSLFFYFYLPETKGLTKCAIAKKLR